MLPKRCRKRWTSKKFCNFKTSVNCVVSSVANTSHSTNFGLQCHHYILSNLPPTCNALLHDSPDFHELEHYPDCASMQSSWSEISSQPWCAHLLVKAAQHTPDFKRLLLNYLHCVAPQHFTLPGTSCFTSLWRKWLIIRAHDIKRSVLLSCRSAFSLEKHIEENSITAFIRERTAYEKRLCWFAKRLTRHNTFISRRRAATWRTTINTSRQRQP